MHETVDINRYLEHSAKIEVGDLNWNEARQAGLTDDERFLLTYFADIEGQTIFYLRDLLNTKASDDPDTVAFLTMWNYEEFFHARTLARLLAECGSPMEKDRLAEVRRRSQLSEKFTAWGSLLLSKLFPDSFLALYMTWGAVNELTTLRGYEELERRTENPTFRELCRRIAKQERRHFAWYFNSAQTKLARSSRARRLTRTILNLFWTPVGAGVKTDDEVFRLMVTLFPGENGKRLAQEIDGRISTLPGLEGIRIMHRFAQKASSFYEKSSSDRRRSAGGLAALSSGH
jgi:rubrerythrin